MHKERQLRSFEPIVETWSITKPVVESRGGVVASQHYFASEVGARVLESGGNAVDAAVAAGLAIGTVEPWMSGLGGGGYMVVYLASEDRCQVVDFGMRAPLALDVNDYPLAPSGMDGDLFGWPAVVDDRNVTGALAFATPGFVAGMATALERFGSLSWRDALAPAIDSARRGFVVDWFATLKIAAAAKGLSAFPESARTYLPDGFAPAGEWGGPPPKITLGKLADSLSRLSDAGAEDFYRGDLAKALIDDVREAGGRLASADLEHYRPQVLPALTRRYRGARVFAAPELTAGPSLHRALEILESEWQPKGSPDAAAYAAYARSLSVSYAERLERMGEIGQGESCTTHLSVVDRAGNMVALTQTLLSVFGSKVMLPRTGILMNNGIMWFDPRPGVPNAMAPGKRPLANMCPTVVDRGDGVRIAVGASGGRRIMPAVFQLISFLVDFRMDLDSAVHQGRIDVSGAPPVIVDQRLGEDTLKTLSREHETFSAPHGVYPALFACPNVVVADSKRKVNAGGAFVMSPWAAARAEGVSGAD
ncbi:MAG: gamma-glutamyltransferase [Gammaproteobacteria bacterium]|nr:gamma-glutamyltransferase [Gammaproteobacteria bacterium]